MKIPILVGNLTQEPKVLSYNGGTGVSFNIADNYYAGKDKEGKGIYKPNYWKVVIFGKGGDRIINAPIGSKLIISNAEIRQSTYEKEDGTTVRTYDVHARFAEPVQKIITSTNNVPAANVSAANAPAANAPVANAPTANTPTANTPTANTPTANTPTANTPVTPAKSEQANDFADLFNNSDFSDLSF